MNKKISILFSSVVAMLFPLAAFAATNFICDIFTRFINLILWPIFLALVVIMGIWAGILFLIARGDPSKIDEAKSMIIWIVIGVIVAFLAFSVVGLISSFVDPGGSTSGFCGDSSSTPPPDNATGACYTDTGCIQSTSGNCNGVGWIYDGDGSTCPAGG